MAPREATGSFPDQYLLFDYDSIVAPAVTALPPPPAFPPHQPPPQPPTPPQGGHAAFDHSPLATGGPSAFLQQHQQQQDGVGGGGEADAAAHHSSPTTSTAAILEDRGNGALSPVDPLSIDPTNTTGSHSHNHPHVTHHPAPQQQSQPHSSNNSGNPWNHAPQRVLFSSQQHHSQPTPPPPRVVSSNSTTDPSFSSPLSTGSSVFYGATTGGGSSTGNHGDATSSPLPSPQESAAHTQMNGFVSATAPWNQVSPPTGSRPRHQHSSNHSLQENEEDQVDAADDDNSSQGSAAPPHEATHVVMEEDTEDDDDDDEDMGSVAPHHHSSPQQQQQQQQMSSILSAGSEDSSDSMRMIYRNVAFDGEEFSSPPLLVDGTALSSQHHHQQHSSFRNNNTSASPRAIMLSFGPNTTVEDLKYFAERGCIVALLEALKTPRLVALGTRMLADYAKMAHRRVAVASNKRILDFLQRTMLQVSDSNWIGREYAVETIRSLTATEASDPYLMSTPGLLKALALVSIGGPFVTTSQNNHMSSSSSSSEHMILTNHISSNHTHTHRHPSNNGTNSNNNHNNGGGMMQCTVPLASEKAQLHACIAIMNLSCGKANKMEIAQVPAVLEAMRDVMLGTNEEACLKATTCIKNLSNADANDAALLGTSALVEALGHVAATTCSGSNGATVSTTNACLALMNLSISKANKHRVFRTPGVMEALMKVLERTRTPSPANTEARVKACSALSNLAIGYDNKIPMFHFPGFVPAILSVIESDRGEARTKACSILWSFAAEIKNQVPVVERGDILPVLVRVAQEDATTEARFKCVAALTLLAESLENAVPLLQAGALVPLMDILQQAGADPTQWKGQTASWCVGFLMNISQSDEAVPTLRQAGVVELLAPLLTLDHYQSLKAAMAVTFCCRFDKNDECYDLLRKTESVIPKIINLLHNTLAGRGGNGYKYGVFTLRSSVGCIAALACGPDFMKERIATGLVFESLLCVVSDFCVDGGTGGAIVGGGREDVASAKLAVQALQALTAHLIPSAGTPSLPFGAAMEERLITAYEFYIQCPDVEETSRQLAADAKYRMEAARAAAASELCKSSFGGSHMEDHDVASMASNCCGALEYFPSLTVAADDDGTAIDLLHGLYIPSLSNTSAMKNRGSGNHSHGGGGDHSSIVKSSVARQQQQEQQQSGIVRTFLLADSVTGLRFVVPSDPSGGRFFNDNRRWCYRRGRFCQDGETPDPAYVWTPMLQQQYEAALSGTFSEPSPVNNDMSKDHHPSNATAATSASTTVSASSHGSSSSNSNDSHHSAGISHGVLRNHNHGGSNASSGMAVQIANHVMMYGSQQ